MSYTDITRTRTIPTIITAIMMTAGTAAAIKPGRDAAAQAARERADVLATFRTGADDGPVSKSAPEAAPKPVIASQPTPAKARWSRPELAVPADLLAAELQRFYLYDGKPVALPLDGARIGVKFAGLQPTGGDEPLAAALAKLGVAVKEVTAPGVSNWRIVTLAQPLGDAGAVNAVLELLLTDPAVEFATPVFHSAAVQGGFFMITPEINARVREELVPQTDRILRESAPKFQVLEGGLGGLDGARQLRAVDRNGFAVLRAANRLNLDERIAWAEPDALATMEMGFIPNDEFWDTSLTWGWEQASDIDTDATAAWDISLGNPAIKVLVMDCGAEQDHPDLNQLPGRDFTTGAVGGVAGGGPVELCDNHGTAVSGIISGRINNSIGGAGVAPNSRVISARIGSTACNGFFTSFSGSWIANALAWGQAQGCQISNSSFSSGNPTATMTSAYDNTQAAGMIHFASTGNGGFDGIGDAAINYPSSLASVNAVTALDDDGTRAHFANYGTGIDFATPGDSVISTDRQGEAGYNDNPSSFDGDYCAFDGTSAAAPFCAGVCALAWGVFPNATPAAVLAAMRSSCLDLGDAGYDTEFGWGFPNAEAAIRALAGPGDYCSGAIAITSSVYNPAPFSTTGHTTIAGELQESCELSGAGVSRTVWFSYVPNCNGLLSINTSGSSYDTVLSVWRGTCTSAVQIGCDDDGGTGTTSQLTGVAVTAGMSYLIKAAAYGAAGAGGTLDFNFMLSPFTPVNDECSLPTVITTTPATFHACSQGAGTDACESLEVCELNNSGTGKSIWYEYTPAVNGRADIDTEGSGYDTVLSVWAGCAVPIDIGGTPVCLPAPNFGCDDDSGSGTLSRLTGVNMRKGVPYKIKVAGYGLTTTGGDTVLNFAFRRCPADHNHSGTVTVQDLFDFLADYFAGNSWADYNNSNTLSVQDIFDFLAIFFEGLCE